MRKYKLNLGAVILFLSIVGCLQMVFSENTTSALKFVFIFGALLLYVTIWFIPYILEKRKSRQLTLKSFIVNTVKEILYRG